MAALTKTDNLEKQILNKLIRGHAQAGDRLSPIRHVAETYQVSYVTAQKAIKNLQKKGILECRQGDGVYVADLSKRTGLSDLGPLLLDENEMPAEPATTTKRIGLILPQWVRGYGGLGIHEMIRSITHYSDVHHWQIELINDNSSRADWQQDEPAHGHLRLTNDIVSEAVRPEFLDKIALRHLDGIVWLQPLPEHKMNLMRLVDRGYQVVCTGRKFPDLPVTTFWADTRQLAETVARFAHAQHKQNVLIMSNSMIFDYYCREYVENLVDGCAAMGIDIAAENVYSVPDRFDNVAIRTRFEIEFLDEHPEADLIILLHDYFYPALQACLEKGAFKQPQELTIVDIPGEFCHDRHEWCGVPIRRIRHPLEDISRAVVAHFEDAWLPEDERPASPPIDLSVRLE